jgi:hypothetical protein
MAKDKNSPESARKVAEDTCKLCGDTFPVSGMFRAETCSQWCHYAVRNLPDPGDFSAMVALSLLSKLCLLTVTVNRGIHAIEHIEDVSLDFSNQKGV